MCKCCNVQVIFSFAERKKKNVVESIDMMIDDIVQDLLSMQKLAINVALKIMQSRMTVTSVLQRRLAYVLVTFEIG